MSAYQMMQEIYQEEPWEMGFIYERLGTFFLSKDDFKNLIRYSKKNIATFEGLEGKIAQDYAFLANGYHNLGTGYEASNQLALALQNYQKSVDIYASYLKEDSKKELGSAYSQISIVYRRIGQLDHALRYANQAIQIQLEEKNIFYLVISLTNKASVLTAMERFDEALNLLQEAIGYVAPELSAWNGLEPIPEEVVIHNKSHLLEILWDKAKLYEKRAQTQLNPSDLEWASQVYDHILALANRMRTALESDQSKKFLVRKARQIVADGIRINAEQYDRSDQTPYLEQIFDLMELSKSVILMDAISEAAAIQKGGIPIAQQTREKSLKIRIAELEAMMYKNPELQQKLRPELVELKLEWSN